MSGEQVKGIPADLREHYEECGKYQNAHLILCRQLIERIARSEQALAALEAENATLKSFQYNFEHATSLERAENEQKVAALEAERDEFKRKCEELCCAHGSALIEIHRGWADALAALEARNRKAVSQFAEALRLVEFYRNTHGCEDADICTGCAAASKLLAARAALKGAS